MLWNSVGGMLGKGTHLHWDKNFDNLFFEGEIRQSAEGLGEGPWGLKSSEE